MNYFFRTFFFAAVCCWGGAVFASSQWKLTKQYKIPPQGGMLQLDCGVIALSKEPSFGAEACSYAFHFTHPEYYLRENENGRFFVYDGEKKEPIRTFPVFTPGLSLTFYALSRTADNIIAVTQSVVRVYKLTK